MSTIKKLIILFFMLFLSLKSFATDIYPFNNPNDTNRFKSLTTELRCLVCQNQNLSESNAPLASDLRQQIYLQIKQGQSDQAIIAYLKARFGNFILYRPPLSLSTIVLWLGPFILLITMISFLIYYIRNTIKD